MYPKEYMIMQNAGFTRTLSENKIIHISDAEIKNVYLLKKGMMKISNISDGGKEIIKYIINPGTLFGELNLLENEEDRHEIAIAMQDCEICFVQAETLKELMLTNKAFRKSIHQSISNRITQTEERMFSLMLKGVKERILDFLKTFVTEFGHPVHGGYQAKNFLTHEEIAKLTTTSRQTVCSSLTYFKKTGLIDYDSENLKVFDLPVY